MKYRWVKAEEGHDSGLVRIPHQPFRSHCDGVGVESVELELEVMGSDDSKRNVASVTLSRAGN